jgi:hypothetical protein
MQAWSTIVHQDECVNSVLIRATRIVEEDRLGDALGILGWSIWCVCTGSLCAIAHQHAVCPKHHDRVIDHERVLAAILVSWYCSRSMEYLTRMA